MHAKLTDLDALKALLGLDQKTFVERYGIQPAQIRPDLRYQGLTGVTEIYNPGVSPARFFFREGKLALVYLSDGGTLSALDPSSLKAKLGGEGATLRSRAGKTSMMHVYPEQGVAVSMGKKVEFVELFSPRSLDEYRHSIYVEVGPFIK